MSSLGGLAAALSSSPGSFTSQGRSGSVTEVLYQSHKKKQAHGTALNAVKEKTRSASTHSAVFLDDAGAVATKSLPVNIPSKREKRLSHGSSASALRSSARAPTSRGTGCSLASQ